LDERPLLNSEGKPHGIDGVLTNWFKLEKREEKTLKLERKKKKFPLYKTINSLRHLSARVGDGKT